MSVFINSKKALEFKSPSGIKHYIPSNYIGTVPDWVPETWLYKAACKDGSITFIGEQKSQIVIEKPENVIEPLAGVNDTPKTKGEPSSGDTGQDQQEEPPKPSADETAQEASNELIQLRERAKALGIRNYQNMKEETLIIRIAEEEARLKNDAPAEGVDENQMALDGANTEAHQ